MLGWLCEWCKDVGERDCDLF